MLSWQGLLGSQVSSIPSTTAPTATDNCVGAITATTDATFPITDQGTYCSYMDI